MSRTVLLSLTVHPFIHPSLQSIGTLHAKKEGSEYKKWGKDVNPLKGVSYLHASLSTPGPLFVWGACKWVAGHPCWWCTYAITILTFSHTPLNPTGTVLCKRNWLKPAVAPTAAEPKNCLQNLLSTWRHFFSSSFSEPVAWSTCTLQSIITLHLNCANSK